jgi:hypothetical protein
MINIISMNNIIINNKICNEGVNKSISDSISIECESVVKVKG